MREDHVTIVTGAGGGLGGVMARALLAAGRRVVAADVERGGAGLATLMDAARAQGDAERLLTVTGDVRVPGDCANIVDAAYQHFGVVHALVNNAGMGPYYTPAQQRPRFYQVPTEYWQQLVETNVNGPFLMASAMVQHALDAGWGRIVNVTTSLGTMTAGGMTPYGSAKAALEAATSIWARDLAGTNVTVNVLVPGGASDTPMVPQHAAPDRSQLVSPQVMAAPVVWLVSRASDGVTGRRFIGNQWDPVATVAQNLRNSSAPAAW